MALQVWLPLNGDTHNQGLIGPLDVYSSNSYTDGKIGSAITCSDSYPLYTTYSPKRPNNFSVCAWIYRDNDDSWQYALSESRIDSTETGYGLHLNYKQWIFSNVKVSAGEIQINKWHHVALTIDANMLITSYLDGQMVESKQCTRVPTYDEATGLGISCFRYDNNNIYRFKGRINDYRYYDHCLSLKEVKEIAKGLVLHYPLNDAYVEGTVNINNSKTITDTCYNRATGQYNYGPTTDMYRVDGVFQGKQCTKVYMGTDGLDAHPFVSFYPLHPANGAYKTLSFDYFPTICNNIVFYTYGGSATTSYVVNGIKSTSSNGTKTIPVNIGQWNHIEFTLLGTSDSTSGWSYMQIGNTNHTSSTSNYWLFANVQIEEKDHATPYTPNTRNETTVYDCSGYQNNGTVEEFKAAGNNLVTGLTAGGQTTVSGETITTSGVNADTYFTINLSESIVVGQTYTLSCIGKNIPIDGYFGFPLGKQVNTSLMFNIKNGYNKITFTANDISWGTNCLFMDDMGRDTACMNQCEFTSFKLYKHSTINSGLNTVFDSPRYKIGAKFNGQHAIWLSSPLGSGAKEELTVSFWHKPNSQGKYRTIASNNNPHSGFWIGCNCEGYGLWYYGNGFYVRSQSFLSNDMWYHCALTYKNQTYQWYLNGVPVTTSTSGTFKAPTFSDIISIGGNTNGDMKGSSGDYRQWGSLSDFRIYSTALSAEDIKELYNTSAYVSDNGTLLTYNVEE